MLNGTTPLLVIFLKNKITIDLFSGVGPPSNDDLLDLPLPIPIYLTELPLNSLAVGGNTVGIGSLSGIYINNETHGIDVVTKVDPVTTLSPTGEREDAQISQTAVDSQVSINMITHRDSVFLNVILAVMDLIIKRLVSAEYSIAYLNGPTVIFGGLLHRFSTSVSDNDNLVRMELVISTAGKESPTAKAAITAIPKFADAVHP